MSQLVCVGISQSLSGVPQVDMNRLESTMRKIEGALGSLTSAPQWWRWFYACRIRRYHSKLPRCWKGHRGAINRAVDGAYEHLRLLADGPQPESDLGPDPARPPRLPNLQSSTASPSTSQPPPSTSFFNAANLTMVGGAVTCIVVHVNFYS
ncbi:hypothetical protein AX16_005863 [Volvariella volvacea WC 439]|nr:hypothetical protein AX16_005863 [Volvariella volvacea WC 439]